MSVFGIPTSLSIDPEICVVQALHEEVPSLVAIKSPRLNRQRLILVVIVALLFVLVLDDVGNELGRAQCPDDESAEEVELRLVSKSPEGQQDPFMNIPSQTATNR